MNALIEKLDWQLLEHNGKPEFAVIPYEQYLNLLNDEPVFPQEVIELELKHDNIIKAWRLHLGFTQKDVARRAGISSSALSQIEKPNSKPHKATLEKIAKAMSLDLRQLEE